MVAAVIVASAGVALAWVFFVPMLEAPDETVHFEYATALYSAGGLVAPRDSARLTIPAGRPVPYPKYLEDQSAVAVIAEKPDVKAPAGYGSATYYDSVDRDLQRDQTAAELFNPPLLRYYPFGYYLLDAAVMGVASLFTSSRPTGYKRFSRGIRCMIVRRPSGSETVVSTPRGLLSSRYVCSPSA